MLLGAFARAGSGLLLAVRQLNGLEVGADVLLLLDELERVLNQRDFAEGNAPDRLFSVK